MTSNQIAKWVGSLIAIAAIVLAFSIIFLNGSVNTELADPIEIPARAAIPESATVFDSTLSGNSEIYSRSASGENLALTTDPNFDSWRPRLSQDRRTVLFNRSPAGVYDTEPEDVSLWMVAATGGDAVEVFAKGAHGWSQFGNVEWSPSGEQLAVMAGRPGQQTVWISSADGRFVRKVDTGPGEAFDPSWSPDGERVLFVGCPEAGCEPNERELFVVRLDGGERSQLTSDDVRDQQPVFSPDGSRIVMRSQTLAPTDDGTGGVWDIRVLNMDRREIGDAVVGDTSTSGSPRWIDSSNILFHRIVPGADQRGIYTVSIASGAVGEWLETEANEGYPDP